MQIKNAKGAQQVEISYLNYFTLSHYMSESSCLNAMKKYDFLETN